MKKFIIFFIFIPLVYSEIHKFITTYTAINGQTTAGTPEFSAVTTLDDHQIEYYDSNIKKLIPRQDWMEEFASTEPWKKYIEIRKDVQQIFKINIPVIMQRFNQSHGLHTYQRMYGCEYDDETGDSQVFDHHGYDGEDFISLDLKEIRYTASVPQGILTVMKWNNDREKLISQKQYYNYECVYWLKELLHLSKAAFEKTEPKVSLLQKNPDYYVECHVTGFLFRNTSISWRKNGQDLRDSSKLEYRDTLPNENGTFQRTVALYVLPDEWKKDRYSCVVEHKSLTETIQKILTEDQIMRNKSASDASYIKSPALVSILVIVLIVLCVLCKRRKKLAAYCKKTNNGKSKPSPEHAPDQDSLVSTPSNESSSPSEVSDLSVRGSSRFLHRDEQNHSPEPSPSQFLTGRTTTGTFYEDHETFKDL
ncbi:major histocompatibility complex class I-related protein 1-like isoform X2 [Siphateles boraxobius]|uniref:major histocompatibility complex class I-related protein 1-like isoform X2 n=1 Tax=Siphateles boraxobius TaxID=180520 RepID=UPI004064A977